jgi:hypothetical protein
VTALTSRFARSCKKCGVDTVTGLGLVADARRWGDGGLGKMQYLLILLVAVTMACGAAAGVTIALAPAYADDSAKGY